MLRFGFELEGFYSPGAIDIPPNNYPSDGFPGLVEFRSTGGKDIEDAYFEVLKQFVIYPGMLLLSNHRFSTELISKMRSTRDFNKRRRLVRNLYGLKEKESKDTIASLQINISNEIYPELKETKDRAYQPPKYGLLDIPLIVGNLDQEFSEEIKLSKRQPGWYRIKGNILEYRSLPNSVFRMNPSEIRGLLNRFKKAINGTN